MNFIDSMRSAHSDLFLKTSGFIRAIGNTGLFRNYLYRELRGFINIASCFTWNLVYGNFLSQLDYREEFSYQITGSHY